MVAAAPIEAAVEPELPEASMADQVVGTAVLVSPAVLHPARAGAVAPAMSAVATPAAEVRRTVLAKAVGKLAESSLELPVEFVAARAELPQEMLLGWDRTDTVDCWRQALATTGLPVERVELLRLELLRLHPSCSATPASASHQMWWRCSTCFGKAFALTRRRSEPESEERTAAAAARSSCLTAALASPKTTMLAPAVRWASNPWSMFPIDHCHRSAWSRLVS